MAEPFAGLPPQMGVRKFSEHKIQNESPAISDRVSVLVVLFKTYYLVAKTGSVKLHPGW